MPPSKEKLIQKYFHEFHGMVCQAVAGASRNGDSAELSRQMHANSERIKTLIRQLVDEVYPPNLGDTKPNDDPPPPTRMQPRK